MLDAWLLVLAGAFAGGFVSGLTGFGTGLTALPIWLFGLTPALASPLVVVCSLIGQFQTLPAIWHAIDFRRCTPFIVGGLVGVPFGAYALPFVPVQLFKLAVGALLVGYCGYTLLGRVKYRVTGGGKLADGVVGLGGGVLGGLAGISGPFPTIWTGLRGWEKDDRRAVLQTFNTAILSFALVAQIFTGLLTPELWQLVVIALPGTVLGSWIGRRIYGVLDSHKFEKVVLLLLMLSGAMLLFAGIRQV